MAVIVQFGNIGGTHSDPIVCTSRTTAARLAANLAFVMGGYVSTAHKEAHWTLDGTTKRINWENASRTFFIEVRRQE